MSFMDWVRESAQRYRTTDARTATRRNLAKLRMGAFKRLNDQMDATRLEYTYLVLRHGEHPAAIWDRGDWDVLVILDGCRTDLYTAVAHEYPMLPSHSTGVWSNASCSIDWITRNLNAYPMEAARTGYVTANPFSHHHTDESQNAGLGDGPVGYFAPLYRTHWQECTPSDDEGDGIMTVPPDPVTEYAIAAWRERDALGIDRLIVHYLQPHEPYISRPEWADGDNKLFDDLITDGEKQAGESIWPRVQDGDVPVSELWDAMVMNLRWVLDDVTERLLPNLDGSVVLSSDHGNALGEIGEWHHLPGAIGPAVRRVPWVELACSDQGTHTPGVELHRDWNLEDMTEREARDRLEALGYLEAPA